MHVYELLLLIYLRIIEILLQGRNDDSQSRKHPWAFFDACMGKMR